jgi:predicted negative regulator of RcsB-dependent stress response
MIIATVEDDHKEIERMKQWWRRGLVAVLGLLSLLPWAAAHAQHPKSICQVTALEGKVDVLR